MVFCLMNRDIATTVPGVKNVAEMEELAECVALPPIPPPHLTRLEGVLVLFVPLESERTLANNDLKVVLLGVPIPHVAPVNAHGDRPIRDG